MTDTRVKIRCEFCQVPSQDSRVIDHLAGCAYRRWQETGNAVPLLDALERAGWARLLADPSHTTAEIIMFGRNRLTALTDSNQDTTRGRADGRAGRPGPGVVATLRRLLRAVARRAH